MASRAGTLLLSFCSLIALGHPAAGQGVDAIRGNSATILASATVITDRMGFASVRPVAFEVRRSARSTTVRPTDAAAGEWRLVGRAATQVRVKLTLPAELVNQQSPDAAALPIVFSRTAGRLAQGDADAAAATTFDPQEGAVGRFGTGATPTLSVWLGSTVETAASTVPGAYRGTVTLTLFYY
jgi:hypothetical protein